MLSRREGDEGILKGIAIAGMAVIILVLGSLMVLLMKKVLVHEEREILGIRDRQPTLQ